MPPPNNLPFWKPPHPHLSQAITLHLGLMWTPDSEQKILTLVGPDGLNKIKEIDAYANRPDLWTTGNTTQNYTQLKKDLAHLYPFLTPEARESLATRAAWSWR